ncbi:MAG: phage holin family protein [Balneolaceae bacterium]
MILVWLLNSVAVYITSKLLTGVEIKNFWTAIIVAALLAIVNTLIRPVLAFISFPITILTLGLFIFVIDALMVLLVDKLVADFKIKSFGWALLFALIMTPISYLLLKVFA